VAQRLNGNVGFLFAFICFNLCFTIQVYHGAFTEFVQLIPYPNLALMFLIPYFDDTFWSVSEFNSLWILLEVRGSYFLGSLWCWRYLSGTSKPVVGEEIWVLLAVRLRISCILTYGAGPFVWSFQDRCNLVRASCLFYGDMSGSYRDLLGTGWEESWARTKGKVCGRWWVWIVKCGRHLQSLCILGSRFLCCSLPVSAFLEWLGLRRKLW
jgi:hypothetical protein